uniref:Uncharacterized protein n=1 Tax=Anguilla anguilla TaxID=7936 RepID=A0A0E9USR7_ANGAN
MSKHWLCKSRFTDILTRPQLAIGSRFAFIAHSTP